MVNVLEMILNIMAAGLAAGNLMNALYFMGLFALVKGVMLKMCDGGDVDVCES